MEYLLKNKPQIEMTADPLKYPQGYFKEKPCKWCQSIFKPQAPSHMYCSQECADIALQDSYLLRNYNITKKEFDILFKKQKGLCAICFTEGFKMSPKQKLKLVVDHCHTTGKVRGLLCHNCNRALGLLKDNKNYFNNCLLYLEGATTIPTGSTSQAIGDGSA